MKLLLLFVILILSTCDSLRVDENELKVLKTEIRVNSPLDAYKSPAEIPAVSQRSVPFNETTDFWGLIFLDGKPISDEEKEKYIQNSFWVYNSDTLLGDRAKIKFTEAQSEQIFFYAIDALNDTLKDTVRIYANKALNIKVIEPIHNDLTIDPCGTDPLTISWILEGLDTWETPLIKLFAGLHPDSTRLIGETSANKIKLKLNNFCAENKSVGVYWFLEAIAMSNMFNTSLDIVWTPMYYFQTKQPHSNKSVLPLKYRVFRGKASKGNWLKAINTTIDSSIYISPSDSLMILDYLPPGDWIFIAGDSLHLDYKPDSVRLVLEPGVVYIDTVILNLKDSIAPRVILDSTFFESLRFRIFDGGAGIDIEDIEIEPKNKFYFEFNDSISDSHNLYITLEAKEKLYEDSLYFIGTDLAGNLIPQCKWYVKYNPKLSVAGPFCHSDN
ncbi:MAG: hypothetical protein GX801_02275 [Fibrobacter sp.]|nr:hypothetical protein [Fibrobacter sp.]